MTKNGFRPEPVPCLGRLHRAIDANLNRSREALRVCEDVTRFLLNDKTLTKSLKDARHRIGRIAARLLKKDILLIKHRDTSADIGRKTGFDGTKTSGIGALFYKNIHRAEESIRALEEFSKLMKGNLSVKFKTLRFRVYLIEKKAIKKLKVFYDID